VSRAFFLAFRLLVRSALLASAGACAVSQAAAPVLVNGDFEAGASTAWSISTTANGRLGVPAVVPVAAVGGISGQALRVNAGALEFDTAMALQGGDITQSFMLADGGAYHLSADIGVMGQWGLNSEAGRFSLWLDGQLVADHAFGDIDEGEFQFASLSHVGVLSAGAHSVAVQVSRAYVGDDSQTPFQFIDNVAITAVPEPSRLVLGLFGLVALMGAAGRRIGA
jgi:hypothetical protein